MLNRSGERGHPCLVPLDKFMGSDKLPGVIIVVTGAAYMFLKEFKKFPLKPIYVITVNNQSRLTLSKAFLASKVNIIVSGFGCCLAYSNATSAFLMFVTADLPLTNLIELGVLLLVL